MKDETKVALLEGLLRATEAQSVLWLELAQPNTYALSTTHGSIILKRREGVLDKYLLEVTDPEGREVSNIFVTTIDDAGLLPLIEKLYGLVQNFFGIHGEEIVAKILHELETKR